MDSPLVPSAAMVMERFGITFPLAMDPEFQMQKYFQRNAVPVNMLIDLRTMRIHFFQTGVSLSRVGQEMVAFFSRLDNGN